MMKISSTASDSGSGSRLRLRGLGLLFFNSKTKQTPRTSKPRMHRRATHDGIMRHVNELKYDESADSGRDYDVLGFSKRTSAPSRRVALAVLLAGLAILHLNPKTGAPARPRHDLDDVVDGLRQTMLRDSFVHIDGATFRELLVWQGADPSDLDAIEMGKIHAATEQDKEPTMAFRQIAFHRMVSLEGKPFVPAQYRAITQIAEKEISSADGARVYFERSGTREWNLPPPSYAQSSLPAALARVNTLLMSDWQHTDQPNLKQHQSAIINDQLLIKVNKLSDSEESPTPEGVHQDGTEVSSVTMIERKGIKVGAPRARHPRYTRVYSRFTHASCAVQPVAPRALPRTSPPRTPTPPLA